MVRRPSPTSSDLWFNVLPTYECGQMEGSEKERRLERESEPSIWRFSAGALYCVVMDGGDDEDSTGSCGWENRLILLFVHRKLYESTYPRLSKIYEFLSLSIYLALFTPSIHPPICISIFLSIHPPIHPSICISIFLSIHPSICISIYLSIYPSIHPFVYLSFYLSIHPSICISVVISIHPTIYSSICISVVLSIHPSIYPSIHLYTHRSICPSIHPSIYPPIYLSTYLSMYSSIYLYIYVSI